MYVFIDTNIVTSAKFQFYRGGLGELNRYIKENYVTLIVTSVLEAEFKHHYNDRLKELNNKYNGLCNDLNEYDIKSPWESFQSDLNEKIYLPLEEFLSRSENIKLDLSLECIKAIVDDYQVGRPPFSGSKKDEFKDAINIHLLKALKKSISEPIHIVSTDEAFRQAFSESNHDFIVHNNINRFLPVIRQLKPGDKNIGEVLTNYFNNVTFKNEVISYLKNRDNYKPVDYNIRIQSVKSVEQLDFTFALSSLAQKECEGILYIKGLAYVSFISLDAGMVFFDDFDNPIDLLFNGTVLIDTPISFKVRCKDSIENNEVLVPVIDKFDIDWSKLNVTITKNRMQDGSMDLTSIFK